MSSLRRIYNGKSSARRNGDLTRTMEMKSGFKARSAAEPEDEVVDGVKFTPVNEVSIFFEMIYQRYDADDVDGFFSLFQTELEYDPELYRRDREGVDYDFDSVNSSPSSDSHSYAPPPQLAFERHRPDENFANISYQGPRYEPELPDPPPLPASGPPYAGAVWSPPNRQLRRHPSPLSHVPSHQLADSHTRSREASHFRPPTNQAHETPGNYHITESKRQSREVNTRTREPRVSRGRGGVNPSTSGPIISSNQHHSHNLQTSLSTIARQGS